MRSQLLTAGFHFASVLLRCCTDSWAPLAGVSLLAISRSPRQNLEPFSARRRYAIPRADPMVLPRSRSNEFPLLAPRAFVTWSTQCLGLYPANSRVREISSISATRPLQMDGLILSPLRRFVTSRLRDF
jgi:hypothetical protein